MGYADDVRGADSRVADHPVVQDSDRPVGRQHDDRDRTARGGVRGARGGDLHRLSEVPQSVAARFLFFDLPAAVKEEDIRMYFGAFATLEEVTLKKIESNGTAVGSVKYVSQSAKLRDLILRAKHMITGYPIQVQVHRSFRTAVKERVTRWEQEVAENVKAEPVAKAHQGVAVQARTKAKERSIKALDGWGCAVREGRVAETRIENKQLVLLVLLLLPSVAIWPRVSLLTLYGLPLCAAAQAPRHAMARPRGGITARHGNFIAHVSDVQTAAMLMKELADLEGTRSVQCPSDFEGLRRDAREVLQVVMLVLGARRLEQTFGWDW
ncbi:unnamed protein product [Prorocentrum cordatum]|uniref:RRM domain-containing protein n=1 Tax=Prorocentrum cordatum TaxID=2364126 RepID=A0ABN9PGJ6_9DINO|nr:unnamed protein product [Polarella glacialis]